MNEERNQFAGVVFIALVLIACGVWLALNEWALFLHVPFDTGVAVAKGITVAAVFAAFVAWLLRSTHPRWFLVSCSVLVAGVSVALWPAMQHWGTELLPLSLPGLEEEGGSVAWWAGFPARFILALALLVPGAYLFWSND